MSSYYVFRVRFDPGGERVEELEVAEKLITKFGIRVTKSRQEVIEDIESGTAYATAIIDWFGNLLVGSPVHVVKTRNQKYLRTDPNPYPADNLGELPSL